MLWEPAFKLDIPFDEPFLEYTTRCNSKTYYYLAVSVFFDIPLLVHSYQYKQNLLKEVRQRTGVESAPIFCIQNQYDYHRQIAGTKYRYKNFIVDDPCVFRYCQLPEEIGIYNPEEVRDLVLTYLAFIEKLKGPELILDFAYNPINQNIGCGGYIGR